MARINPPAYPRLALQPTMIGPFSAGIFAKPERDYAAALQRASTVTPAPSVVRTAEAQRRATEQRRLVALALRGRSSTDIVKAALIRIAWTAPQVWRVGITNDPVVRRQQWGQPSRWTLSAGRVSGRCASRRERLACTRHDGRRWGRLIGEPADVGLHLLTGTHRHPPVD